MMIDDFVQNIENFSWVRQYYLLTENFFQPYSSIKKCLERNISKTFQQYFCGLVPQDFMLSKNRAIYLYFMKRLFFCLIVTNVPFLATIMQRVFYILLRMQHYTIFCARLSNFPCTITSRQQFSIHFMYKPYGPDSSQPII